MKQWAAVIIVCILMGLVARFLPALFIPAIMLLTIAAFQPHYYRLGLYQRQAYAETPPSTFTKTRYQIFSTLRCAWIGSVAGVLPIITVGGSYTERVSVSTLILVGVILAAFLLLLSFRRFFHIRPLEWGLLRLAVPAGVIYSVTKTLWVQPQPMGKVIGWREMFSRDFDKSLNHKIIDMDLNELIEMFHSVVALVDEMIASGLAKIFGEFVGAVAHLFLTIEIAYGLPVMVISLMLLRVWEWVGAGEIKEKLG